MATSEACRLLFSLLNSSTPHALPPTQSRAATSRHSRSLNGLSSFCFIRLNNSYWLNVLSVCRSETNSLIYVIMPLCSVYYVNYDNSFLLFVLLCTVMSVCDSTQQPRPMPSLWGSDGSKCLSACKVKAKISFSCKLFV